MSVQRPPQLVIEHDVAEALCSILEALKPASILDIGCGEGRFAKILSRYSYYVGLDVNLQKLRNYAKLVFHSCEFIASDFFNFHSAKKFDLAFTACFICLPDIRKHIETFADRLTGLARFYLCYEGYYGLDEIIKVFLARNYKIISWYRFPHHMADIYLFMVTPND